MKSIIKFRPVNERETLVFLGNKIVGMIAGEKEGYQYRPRGTKREQWGEFFVTYEDCKNSLL